MTKFRPCIDLHDGKVKQIVGGTLDAGKGGPKTNFVSDKPSSWFASLYAKDKLSGGHIIKLGPGNDEAAKLALSSYPNGMQIGGGITPANAAEWLEAGASHVIATSALFDREGRFKCSNLEDLKQSAGKDRLVIDLSCRRTANGWTVAMDRWQTLTDIDITGRTLNQLSNECAEFLIHAADVEGKCGGIDESLVSFLGEWASETRFPITYAGGASTINDLELVQTLSAGNVDLTIGSALDIFGGSGASYSECVLFNRRG